MIADLIYAACQQKYMDSKEEYCRFGECAPEKKIVDKNALWHPMERYIVQITMAMTKRANNIDKERWRARVLVCWM